MRTIVFEFKDEDLERLDKLREAGYSFSQVLMHDKRGRERYVDICMHNPTTLETGANQATHHWCPSKVVWAHGPEEKCADCEKEKNRRPLGEK